MTINQVALTNTFNEFRVEFNNSANTINSFQDGTANLIIDTITANTFVGVSPDLSVAGNTGSDVVSLVTETFNVFGTNGISTSVSSNSVFVNLSVSGVSAGPYGSASQVPVLTIDAQGRITSAANVNVTTNGANLTSLNASNVATGTLDAARLATSGVIAETYGGASQIPVIVVDDKGRITSASNTSFSADVATFLGTPSSANLAAALTDETGTGVAVFGTNPTLTGVTLAGEAACADNLVTRSILKDYAVEGSAIGATGATATIDMEVANFFSATIDEACTFTFSNPPASGDFGAFVLELTNGGAFTVTYPASVDFPGGTAPTLTATGVDQLVFTTRDGGTTYFAFVAGLDIKSP